MDELTPERKSMQRMATVQRWMEAKLKEVCRAGFYGEVAVSLKFEDGHCTIVESLIRERTK